MAASAKHGELFTRKTVEWRANGAKLENGRRLPYNVRVYGKFRLKGLRMLGDGGGQKVASHFGVVPLCGGK